MRERRGQGRQLWGPQQLGSEGSPGQSGCGWQMQEGTQLWRRAWGVRQHGTQEQGFLCRPRPLGRLGQGLLRGGGGWV